MATGTADDKLWPMIQKKLEVLNKAGLTKDNFCDSDSRNVEQRMPNKDNTPKVNTRHHQMQFDNTRTISKEFLEDDSLDNIDWESKDMLGNDVFEDINWDEDFEVKDE